MSLPKAPIKKRTTARAKIAAKTRPARPTPSDVGAAHYAPAAAQSEAAEDENSSFSNFANSKRDKRIVKHSAFVSKIEKANKKPLKRRRTGKGNLQTKLEGLVDALPDIEAAQNEGSDDDWEGMMSEDEDENESGALPAGGSSAEQDMLSSLANMVNVRKSIKKSGPQQQDAKMQMKTLKSGRGAAKRKEKLKGSEMERFAKNLAQMNQANAAAAQPSAAPQPTAGGEVAAPAATANRWAALRGFIGQTMQQSSNFSRAV